MLQKYQNVVHKYNAQTRSRICWKWHIKRQHFLELLFHRAILTNQRKKSKNLFHI